MQFENNSYFIIPGNAILVDGVERSIIYDLNRMDYDILPKELSLAIAMAQGSFQHLFSLLDEADHDFYVPFVDARVPWSYVHDDHAYVQFLLCPFQITHFHLVYLIRSFIETSRNSHSPLPISKVLPSVLVISLLMQTRH